MSCCDKSFRLDYAGRDLAVLTANPAPGTDTLNDGESMGGVLTPVDESGVYAVRCPGGTAQLIDLVLVEQAQPAQSAVTADIDVWILDTEYAPGNPGDVWTPPNALTVLGKVEIRAADYMTLTTEKAVAIKPVSMVLKATSTSTKVYLALVMRSTTVAYPSGTVLTVKMNVARD